MFSLFKKKPSLEEVLAYKNEFVIKNFLKHYDVTEEEAHEFFKETLKWLWLSVPSDGAKAVPMLSLMQIVDEMWHNFILCTRDYELFCKKYFGRFIHHAPSIDDGKRETSEFREQRLRETMSYVYDHLGAETVTKWYSEYPKHYPVERIKALKKD